MMRAAQWARDNGLDPNAIARIGGGEDGGIWFSGKVPRDENGIRLPLKELEGPPSLPGELSNPTMGGYLDAVAAQAQGIKDGTVPPEQAVVGALFTQASIQRGEAPYTKGIASLGGDEATILTSQRWIRGTFVTSTVCLQR